MWQWVAGELLQEASPSSRNKDLILRSALSSSLGTLAVLRFGVSLHELIFSLRIF